MKMTPEEVRQFEDMINACAMGQCIVAIINTVKASEQYHGGYSTEWDAAKHEAYEWIDALPAGSMTYANFREAVERFEKDVAACETDHDVANDYFMERVLRIIRMAVREFTAQFKGNVAAKNF